MEYIKSLADPSGSDRNNCALNAMSIVFRMPYYHVAETFKALGRGKGKGVSVRMITQALNTFKHYPNEADINNYQMPTKMKMSLAKFAKMFPKGKYYVIKSRHALALIDGVWYDNQVPNPRSYVKYFFKVD
jgi:hypothetical protein